MAELAGDSEVPTPEAPQRPRVQSAARAVAILLAVARSPNGLTPREISEELGLGRQATYHLLHTLLETGVLARTDGNRHVLGIRVGTLVEGFSRQLDPSERLAPIVRALSHTTGETAYAAGWRSGEITTFTVVRGTNPVQAAEVSQGYTGNAHARASGKLLLALAPEAVRDAYLERLKLTQLTPNTITKRAVLEREFQDIRDQGFAVDEEEFAPGLCCLAVPFDRGHSPFVLALSAPREYFLERREQYLGELLRLAGGESSPADITI
jgi:DNA-binding IclR family transcriptional regulator